MTSSRTWGIVEEPTGASRGIRVVAEELSGDSVQKFKWGFVATPACRAERWARLVRPAFVGGSRSLHHEALAGRSPDCDAVRKGWRDGVDCRAKPQRRI